MSSSKILAVNDKFCRMIRNDWMDVTKANIIAGVMLLDEYRLHQWSDAGRPANVIVDVGGHYGSFTAMAKILWPNSIVRAYEPHPYSASRFEQNTSEFNNVAIINAAAMPMFYAEPTCQLYLSPNENDGGHTVSIEDCRSGRVPLTVRSVRLIADLQSIGSPAIDILKLDCEGTESMLLEDLSNTGYLTSVGFICGEWHEFESIPKIEASLRKTHTVEIHKENWPNGAFFAWRK